MVLRQLNREQKRDPAAANRESERDPAPERRSVERILQPCQHGPGNPRIARKSARSSPPNRGQRRDPGQQRPPPVKPRSPQREEKRDIRDLGRWSPIRARCAAKSAGIASKSAPSASKDIGFARSIAIAPLLAIWTDSGPCGILRRNTAGRAGATACETH